MILRTATTEDRPRMAALHIESWRSAYRGLLPDSYLGAPVQRDLTARWQAPDTPGDFQLVAEEAGQLLGFVALTDHDGPYVDNLHVSPATRGRGTGEALLRAAANELARSGATTLWLTVLADNLGALRFYERLGGVAGAPFEEEMYGQTVRSRAVRWADLAALTDPPPAG